MTAERCPRCGCRIIVRPGDLDPTCAECRSTPDHCECKPLKAHVAAAPPAEQEPVLLPAVPRYPTGALVGPLREFVEWAERDGLHPETAGAAGLAALVTLTGPARLKLSEVKEIRAILWIALIGIASSGKSPAFEHAFARIREGYAARYAMYESDLAAWEEADAGTRPGEAAAAGVRRRDR